MNILNHLVILAASIVLTASTIFIPVSVPDISAMRSVERGYPVHYYSQNLSRLDPPLFPRSYLLLSPWEYPFRISIVKFIGNVFIYYLLFELIVYVININFTKAVLSPNKVNPADGKKHRR